MLLRYCGMPHACLYYYCCYVIEMSNITTMNDGIVLLLLLMLFFYLRCHMPSSTPVTFHLCRSMNVDQNGNDRIVHTDNGNDS